ncbi:hypothetical protein, partial [Salmonella enterica]|uniref:hypothetical protein n=1 Tax=Salmonella enterica TaxID=28901 RepID=UPI0039EB1612
YSDQISTDNRNIIKKVPQNQIPSGYAGVLSGGAYIENCTVNNKVQYYVEDIDMIVADDNAVNWDHVNTTHKNIFRHELGHA